MGKDKVDIVLDLLKQIADNQVDIATDLHEKLNNLERQLKQSNKGVVEYLKSIDTLVSDIFGPESRHCAACEKELNKDEGTLFSYPCHIDRLLDGNWLHGYTDSEGNLVSGRPEQVYLCTRCANKVYAAAVQKLRELQNSKGVDND